MRVDVLIQLPFWTTIRIASMPSIARPPRGFPRLVAAALLAGLVLAGCQAPPDERPPAMTPGGAADPHSYARPDEVAVTHLDLDLEVRFEERRLQGTATLSLERKSAAGRLHLDTRGLTVTDVRLLPSGTTPDYRLGPADPLLGAALVIPLAADTSKVMITYSTGPDAAALQWLTPRQTSTAKPFLFTQSQAILTRTWIPCQDTPAIRITFAARVRVPPGLLALMSAANQPQKRADGVYEFSMPQPVPSYLIALAAGDLEFRPLSHRAGVYAEPLLADRAAAEFADTERMIEAAERLYGPYRWDRYDILVLPPSFPFGGMENPRLTFLSPTVVAGDRSLVSIVAHELAHSWSGNLVTNATWNDFWLNEGFTVYFEHRIMEALYGRRYERMLARLGLDELERLIESLGAGSPDTHLSLELADRDPDDGVSSIAYEKGSLFLHMLEEAVGRERWDAFLRSYFERFAFQSMTSAGMLAYLRAELIGADRALEERLQLDAWVYGPGLPSNAPEIDSEAFRAVERELERWHGGAGAEELRTAGWSTHEWLYFLRQLPTPSPAERLAELDAAFSLTTSPNAEILSAWFLQAISGGYEPAVPALESFLLRVGRRKFLEPLYERLARTPRGADLARRVYERARPTYHSITTGTIDRILKWEAFSS